MATPLVKERTVAEKYTEKREELSRARVCPDEAEIASA
jgi:hypothetical protein